MREGDSSERGQQLLLFLMIVMFAVCLVGIAIDVDTKLNDLQRRVGQLESQQVRRCVDCP